MITARDCSENLRTGGGYFEDSGVDRRKERAQGLHTVLVAASGCNAKNRSEGLGAGGSDSIGVTSSEFRLRGRHDRLRTTVDPRAKERQKTGQNFGCSRRGWTTRRFVQLKAFHFPGRIPTVHDHNLLRTAGLVRELQREIFHRGQLLEVFRCLVRVPSNRRQDLGRGA